MIKNPLKAGPTLSERLAQIGGQGVGFDYMRLSLAIIVVCFHSIVTAYGSIAQRQFAESLYGSWIAFVLPMFFSLSGFLVAGSLERSKGIATFLGLRALRIFPALAVDTIFCATLIGIVVTIFPLKTYLSDPLFFSYFQNILGVIQYHLPGVFLSNPIQEVNGQLWTIPYELECYLVLAAMGALGIHRFQRLFFWIVLLGILVLEGRVLFLDMKSSSGRVLLMYFLTSVALYLIRSRVRWNVTLFFLSVFLSIAGILFFEKKYLYLAPIPVAYATAYLGLLNPKKIGLLKRGDYSYGIFLYGFPIQQALVALVPFAREWYGNLLLALPLTFIFAAISWHLIEKPVLRKKAVLTKLEVRLPANPLSNLLDRVVRIFSSRSPRINR